MALLEEKLPGVSKVKGDFQVREDNALAHRLQEEEYEGHFNLNVHERRLARQDVTVAKDLQKEEIIDYRQQESRRREELRHRELEDMRHAEAMAQKEREEEEIQEALRLQDEIVARKFAEKERKRLEEVRRQEREDAHLARQASETETRKIRERRRENEFSQREAQRISERERRSQSPSPPPPYPSNASGYQFPVGDNQQDADIEPVMDETERQALQEAEDERLARELEEKEKRRLLAEKRRREQEDIELAKTLQRQESGGGDPADEERIKREQEDIRLAKQLQKQELEKEKQRRREAELRKQQVLASSGGAAGAERGVWQVEASDGTEDDLKLAKRLQLQEIEAQRKRRREVELRRAQQQQGGRGGELGGHQGGRGGELGGPAVTQSLRHPVREAAPPLNGPGTERRRSPRRDADPTQSLPANIMLGDDPGRPPPQGHPFNPVSSYVPAQAGVSTTSISPSRRVQVEPTTNTQGSPRPYRRQPTGKKATSRMSTQV